MYLFCLCRYRTHPDTYLSEQKDQVENTCLKRLDQTHTNDTTKIGMGSHVQIQDPSLHDYTIQSTLYFPYPFETQGPARQIVRKIAIMGICIHYTYIQTHTFDTTTPAPESIILFFSLPPFLSKLCVNPIPFLTKTPGAPRSD